MRHARFLIGARVLVGPVTGIRLHLEVLAISRALIPMIGAESGRLSRMMKMPIRTRIFLLWCFFSGFCRWLLYLIGVQNSTDDNDLRYSED